ncbi:SLC13 family permease [Aneurinibacillus sp. REN35]|uniref:SLC13 family permease n=1 Tax=Aneurinibacillus sp. REN35 TaxID=3237286 RepID=UPI003528CD9F
MHSNVQKTQRMYSLLDQTAVKMALLISVHVLFLLLIMWTDGLDYRAKVSLFAFLSAMTLWVGTKIPAGFVAVGLLVFIVFMRAAEAELLYDALAEEVVWLMIGAFIMGEAVKQSGLAERFSRSIMSRSTKKSQVLFGTASVLVASAFFIPSTSGRAALSMPIIKQLAQTFTGEEKRALAVMVPVIILMSTSATLIGAGAHIVGIGILEKTAGQSVSFLQWMMWGAPFAVVITALTFVIIKKMLWPKDGAEEIEHLRGKAEAQSPQPFHVQEKKTLGLISVLMIGWVTEGIHGYDTALVTMGGAILMMLPTYGVISWKKGLQSVSWNLIVFVAAATALGKVLVDTGVVKWMETEMFGALHVFVHPPEWLTVLVILLITVTSHLYITSHTTRAVVFIPSLLIFGKTVGADPAAVVFLSLLGMNYCITFPVSSKALLLFYEDGNISYDAKQLIKVSAVLMPLYIIVMMVFYFAFWKWTGMDLHMR